MSKYIKAYPKAKEDHHFHPTRIPSEV